MSRRRGAVGSFSLRSLADDGTKPAFAPVSTRKPTTPPAVPHGLSFKFASSLGGNAIERPKPATSVPPMPSVGGGAFTAAGPHQNELLRLTAACDDLRQRLKASNERSAGFEAQVSRTSSMLSQERQGMQTALAAMRTELVTVRAAEAAIRCELASRPPVAEMKTSQFHSAVRSALEVEATQARCADAEARIETLAAREVALTAEVKLLEEARGNALEQTTTETNSNTEAMFSAEELAEKLSKLAAVQADLTKHEDRCAMLKDDVAKYEAMREAHAIDTTKAASDLAVANEALVVAVADADAAKADVVAAQLEQAEVTAKIVKLTARLEERVPTLTVTGANAPTNTGLGKPLASTASAVNACAQFGRGVPFTVAIDAPVSIGALGGPNGTAVDELVKAVVTDLQGFFKQAVESNAKRGIAVAPTGATEASDAEV